MLQKRSASPSSAMGSCFIGMRRAGGRPARSDDAGIAWPCCGRFAAFVQVVVEAHGDDTQQQAAARRGGDAPRADLAPGRRRRAARAAPARAAKYSSKSMSWRRSMASMSIAPWHMSCWMTSARTRSSKLSSRPRHTGGWPRSTASLPGRQLARILAEGVADVADGADAEADQIAVGVRGVAHEIAVQRAGVLRQRQVVVRQREVIHADVAVAGRRRASRSPAAAAPAWPRRRADPLPRSASAP